MPVLKIIGKGRDLVTWKRKFVIYIFKARFLPISKLKIMITGPTIEAINGILSKNLIVGADFEDICPIASNHITGKYRFSGTFSINL